MSDRSDHLGVLYTEHLDLTALSPVPSLWSYESRPGGTGGCSVARNSDGNLEYWLRRTDPLLNAILPGTGVSLIVNFGDLWAAGGSPVTAVFLPRVCVVGPVTHARFLHVGASVSAIGAGLPSALATAVLGVPASELVDRIVPLEDLWNRVHVEKLLALDLGVGLRRGLVSLKEQLVARLNRLSRPESVGQAACRLIKLHSGCLSIDALAASYNLTRQQFGRRFLAATGLPPKLFARITRFQALVAALLSTDVSQWAALSSAAGFYDQAHMINEFRAFTGAPPTVFFRPSGPAKTQLRGRPSEWLVISERGFREA